MDENFKTILGQRFGAAIDMLENALTACPDNLWNGDRNFGIQVTIPYFI